jgi:hypothetical protein
VTDHVIEQVCAVTDHGLDTAKMGVVPFQSVFPRNRRVALCRQTSSDLPHRKIDDQATAQQVRVAKD